MEARLYDVEIMGRHCQSPSSAHTVKARMASEADGKDPDEFAEAGRNIGDEEAEHGTNSDSEADEEEEEEDEPKLKYMALTKSLGPVYRNGDATSAFMVAGDKMVCGVPVQPSSLLAEEEGACAERS